MNEKLSRAAWLSECGRYRFSLRRQWPGGNGQVACFIMLNPSTADGLQDDPTIRRCIRFARDWGYSVLNVQNLFALRATDPAQLLRVDDPVGPHGDADLMAARTADLVVAAWGSWVPLGRDREALRILHGKPLHCLGRTKLGHPRHPLYVRAETRPVLFAGEGGGT